MSNQLPDETIVNILSRLPVKSILRFRCVCKPWYSLLHESNFVKMHLNHAIEQNNFNIMLRHCYLYSIDYEYEAVEIDYPCKSPNYGVAVLGSCNGLLCITPNENVICLWNPSTKEYKKLPTTTIEFPSDFTYFTIISYGFGYDCKIVDYKLVRIVGFVGGYGCEVRVYTLGSNSWKSIPYIPYHLSYGRLRGVLSNGALHWIATPVGSEDSKVIVSFDISNERFQEMPQPDSLDNEVHINVGVLDGCLCLLGNLYKVHVDIWVMKDYGIRESWTKMFTIAQPAVIRSFEYLKPVQSMKNGEILLEKDNNDLVLYDTKNERARVLKIRGIPKWFEIETYVRSLVSLNSGTYVGQEQTKEEIENMKKVEMKKKKKKRGAEVGLQLF